MTIIQVLKAINRKIFAALFVAGLLGVIAVLPYMADLYGAVSTGRAIVPDIPLPLIVILALLQNGILLAVVIAIGMILSGRVGLQMPLIHAWATGERPPRLNPIVRAGGLVGASAGEALHKSPAVGPGGGVSERFPLYQPSPGANYSGRRDPSRDLCRASLGGSNETGADHADRCLTRCPLCALASVAGGNPGCPLERGGRFRLRHDPDSE